MSALLLALLLQPAPPMPPAPPPIIRYPTVVPPSPVLIHPRPAEPATPVHVRVTAGSILLFDDRLSVDSSGANFSQNRSEATSAVCTGPDRYDRQRSSSFNLRLARRTDFADQRQLMISVSWTRPTEPADCSGNGTRGATLVQSVPIIPGKTAVITGDGGLRVEVTPR